LAREIFIKSGLSIEVLGSIWKLVDRDSIGKLNLPMFVLAMWLIMKVKTHNIPISSVFPYEIYNEILSKTKVIPAYTKPLSFQHTGFTPLKAQATGTSVLIQPSVPTNIAPPLSIQNTGMRTTTNVMMASPLGAQLANVSLNSKTTFNTIDYNELQKGISPTDKKQYSVYFDSLDTGKLGSLNGHQCADFFRKSNLPPTDLAAIWELVAQPEGTISRDAFIAAMHVIKQRISGGEIPKKTISAPIKSLLGEPIAPLVPQATGLIGPSTPHSVVSVPIPTGIPLPANKNSSATGLADPITPICPTSSEMTPIVLPSKQPNPTSNKMPPFDLLNNITITQTRGQTLNSDSKTIDPNSKPTLMKENSGFSVASNQAELLSKLSLGDVSSINKPSAFDIAEFKDREKQLHLKKKELNDFQSQIDEIEPSFDELKKKRALLESDYKSIVEKRASVLKQLNQFRTQYASDFEYCKEIQENFSRENKGLEAAMEELNQFKAGLELVIQEKKRLSDLVDSEKGSLLSIKKQIAELSEKTKQTRREIGELEKESEAQQKTIQIHTKLLASSQTEYENLKRDLDRKTSLLQKDKEFAEQLEKKANVQNFMNSNEKLKLESLSKNANPESIVKNSIGDSGVPLPIPSPESNPNNDSVDKFITTDFKAIEKVTERKKKSAEAAFELDQLMGQMKPRKASISSNVSNFSNSNPRVENTTESKKSSFDTAFDFETTFKNSSLKESPNNADTNQMIEFPADNFEFDATFAQPMKPPSRAPKSSFGEFTESFSKAPPVDKNTHDDAFGGSIVSTNPNDQLGDPFDPFDNKPISKPINSFDKPNSASDSAEIKSIIGMGFSKGNIRITQEQAVNSLELFSFDLEKAINYLLESTAK
jgi:hypothetical protein